MLSLSDLIFGITQQRFHRLLKTQDITMKNNQPHINQDKAQTRQLSQLTRLKLEQLEGVAGGSGGTLYKGAF